VPGVTPVLVIQHVDVNVVQEECHCDVVMFPLTKIPPLVERLLALFEAGRNYPCLGHRYVRYSGETEDHRKVCEILSNFVDACKRLSAPANVQRFISIMHDSDDPDEGQEVITKVQGHKCN